MNNKRFRNTHVFIAVDIRVITKRIQTMKWTSIILEEKESLMKITQLCKDIIMGLCTHFAYFRVKYNQKHTIVVEKFKFYSRLKYLNKLIFHGCFFVNWINEGSVSLDPISKEPYRSRLMLLLYGKAYSEQTPGNEVKKYPLNFILFTKYERRKSITVNSFTKQTKCDPELAKYLF